MKEKKNAKKIECPHCGKVGAVLNGHDNTACKTQRYKCKKCNKTFKEDKNYYFKNKADRLFMAHILKLMKLSYSEINNVSKKAQPINFQKIFSIKKPDEKELDNMTLTLAYPDSNKLKNLPPQISIYLKDNEIIIAKSLEKTKN